MADPGDLNLKPLSLSTSGDPLLITSTAFATPTDVHAHPGGSADADLVTLLLCNTYSSVVNAKVFIYTGTPTNPNSIAIQVDLAPNSGAWVVLDGAYVANGRKVGVVASVTGVITAHGRVARATFVT